MLNSVIGVIIQMIKIELVIHVVIQIVNNVIKVIQILVKPVLIHMYYKMVLVNNNVIHFITVIIKYAKNVVLKIV